MKECCYHKGELNGNPIRKCELPWKDECNGNRASCLYLRLKWIVSKKGKRNG